MPHSLWLRWAADCEILQATTINFVFDISAAPLILQHCPLLCAGRGRCQKYKHFSYFHIVPPATTSIYHMAGRKVEFNDKRIAVASATKTKHHLRL